MWAGINASDINFTNGTYLPGVQPPFDTGFEAVGKIVGVGDGVTSLKVGQPVCYSAFGAFAEYKEVEARGTIPVPKCSPEPLTLLVSGLTASIALEKVGELKGTETVLVTAAAGATGSYAVQLAKLAGCHVISPTLANCHIKHVVASATAHLTCAGCGRGAQVIGTCSSDEKCDALRRLGCDRPINYRRAATSQPMPARGRALWLGPGGQPRLRGSTVDSWRFSPPPPPPLVLSGHVASLTPYSSVHWSTVDSWRFGPH